MTERFAITWPPIRMDHAIIRPSQSLVKGGGPAAQFRLSDVLLVPYFFKFVACRADVASQGLA